MAAEVPSMVEVVVVELVALVLRAEMELHQLQQHLQVVLESVIQLQEPQRFMAAAAVLLGTAAQVDGVA